jgi:hypothetical protein
VAPYLGSGRGDPPLALHPSASLVAPYPSSGEGMAQHGNSSQSEVVLIDYVKKAETALNDLARSQLIEPIPAKVRVAVGKPADEILQVAGDAGGDTRPHRRAMFCWEASRSPWCVPPCAPCYGQGSCPKHILIHDRGSRGPLRPAAISGVRAIRAISGSVTVEMPAKTPRAIAMCSQRSRHSTRDAW